MGSLILQGSEEICTNCIASVVIPIINKQFYVGGQAITQGSVEYALYFLISLEIDEK